MDHRSAAPALVLVLSLLLAACGGGGGSGSSGGVPPPSGLSYASPQSIRANVAMTALAPTVTGSVTSYSVNPALPAGITFSTSTGEVSGTPSIATAPATYTITARNAGGSTTFGLQLTVYDLEVQTLSLARIASQNAPINPAIVVRPLYVDLGTMHLVATDATGIILPSVSVVSHSNGTASLVLTTNGSVSPADFSGTVRVDICKDASCAPPQDVLSVSVPFSVRVLASGGAWPGDNLTALSAWAGAPEWTTTQGNAAHTGLVPVAVDPDQFTLRWKTVGNPISTSWGMGKPNLVTSGGQFFVVSSDYLANGVVYAKRESDASEVWHFTLDGMTYPEANPAAVAGGVVYFAAGHQTETYMFARNAADGSPVFQSGMWSQWEGYYSPTIGPNGMVYANAGTYGGLYAFNPQGNQLFFSSQAQQSNWTPAVDATGVYAYTGDRLQVLDPLTGVSGITIQDPNYRNYVYEIGGAPVLGDSALGSVFAAAYTNSILNGGGIGNHLTNFRTKTGTIAWQINGVYPTTPGYKDGVVYAVNQIPLQLEARAESDGTLLWSWAPEYAGEYQFVSEVLLTNNLAFVSTNYATHAIDLATHRSVWNYPMSGKLALSASGVLYIHNATDLVAVNLK